MQRLLKPNNERETAQVDLTALYTPPLILFFIITALLVCCLCISAYLHWLSLLVLRVSIAVQAENMELETLEAQLTANDILLFRTMAERKAHGPKVSLDVVREPHSTEGIQEGTEVM